MAMLRSLDRTSEGELNFLCCSGIISERGILVLIKEGDGGGYSKARASGGVRSLSQWGGAIVRIIWGVVAIDSDLTHYFRCGVSTVPLSPLPLYLHVLPSTFRYLFTALILSSEPNAVGDFTSAMKVS